MSLDEQWKCTRFSTCSRATAWFAVPLQCTQACQTCYCHCVCKSWLHHQHHHASLLNSSIKQVNCVGAWETVFTSCYLSFLSRISSDCWSQREVLPLQWWHYGAAGAKHHYITTKNKKGNELDPNFPSFIRSGWIHQSKQWVAHLPLSHTLSKQCLFWISA
jgi:hypothetical protein